MLFATHTHTHTLVLLLLLFGGGGGGGGQVLFVLTQLAGGRRKVGTVVALALPAVKWPGASLSALSCLCVCSKVDAVAALAEAGAVTALARAFGRLSWGAPLEPVRPLVQIRWLRSIGSDPLVKIRWRAPRAGSSVGSDPL